MLSTPVEDGDAAPTSPRSIFAEEISVGDFPSISSFGTEEPSFNNMTKLDNPCMHP